jgi:hypothetical protein
MHYILGFADPFTLLRTDSFHSTVSLNNKLLIQNKLANLYNPLTPNDNYSGRTAPLSSKRCILYIYSTYICTEYFKHCIYSPFFPLQNAVCFIFLKYLVPVLFKFFIQVYKNLKKIIPAPRG